MPSASGETALSECQNSTALSLGKTERCGLNRHWFAENRRGLGNCHAGTNKPVAGALTSESGSMRFCIGAMNSWSGSMNSRCGTINLLAGTMCLPLGSETFHQRYKRFSDQFIGFWHGNNRDEEPSGVLTLLVARFSMSCAVSCVAVCSISWSSAPSSAL